jgi:signal transduction histidine kinase
MEIDLKEPLQSGLTSPRNPWDGMDNPARMHPAATSSAASPDRASSLEIVVEVMSGLQSDGSDPARILRRIMTHVVDALDAGAALVVRQGADGTCERLRAIGSLDDPEAAEHLLSRLPRPLPDRRTIDRDVVVFPLDVYHLVAQVDREERLRSDALALVELITRHAGQAIENARLREELTRSESLSEVGKAVKRVLHDLRNPIGRIHVAVDRASVPGTDAETVSRMHAIIASSADDVLDIASDVSDFTSSGRITKIRITAESLLAALQDSCSSAGITLRCVNEHRSTVHCDPQKLLRALIRMIESVAGTSAASGERMVEIAAALDGSDTIIAIRGHGFEVSDDVRVRIFEPFAMHSRAGSRGLGLAIVRSIVRAHGGEIALAGQGADSSFVIRLPGVSEPGRPLRAP